MNTKVLYVCFVVLLCLLLSDLQACAEDLHTPLPQPGPGIFFVATNGNDRWSGRLPEPNSTRTDGPYASVEAAQHAVRRCILRFKSHPEPITVFIRGGMYFLKKPLCFTSKDSGTVHAPITYCAFPGESPVLSGGRVITGWRRTPVDGRAIWVATFPRDASSDWSFHELWVNGQRRILARKPTTGYFHIAGLLPRDASNTFGQGVRTFRFHGHDIQPLKGPGHPDVVLMTRWSASHLPIQSVDEGAKTVTFSDRTIFKPDKDDQFYLENALAYLDTPGEWYADGAQGKLYYDPEPGEAPDQTVAIAPRLTHILLLEGNPAAGKYVQHLIFQGLEFANSEWYFSTERLPGQRSIQGLVNGSGFSQAAVGVPAAVWGRGVLDCQFRHCIICHVGNYGLALAGGCRSNQVVGCDFSDLGAGGIKIGQTTIPHNPAEVTERNEIRGCRIHDGGLVFPSAVGIWIGQSPNNQIIHNHIYNFYYTGISIGWTWGYGPATAGGNVVQLNQVDHIGALSTGKGPILSDMGAIYTLGNQQGTVIGQNLIHNVAARNYGGWGIYLDEGTSHIIVESNLVYQTRSGGFHQHYGKDNIVRNNIFAFGRNNQLRRTRNEPHRSFTFEHNVVYWKTGTLIVGELGNIGLATDHFIFDYNDYWRQGGGEVHFEKWNWNQWRQAGEDQHSINADPMFFDADRMDFRLNSDSPAIKLGFRPFVNRLLPEWTDIP